MIVSHTIENPDAAPHVRHLALGFFDGLHLAHREVICNPGSNIPLEQHAVLTFQDHPMALLAPEHKPPLITGMEHKLHILRQWNVGAIFCIPFDRERASQSAEDFLEQLYRSFPNLQTIRCGPNWRFGHNRRGTIPMLSSWSRAHGISLSLPQPVEYLGEWISSSRIRECILTGKLDHASKMLGRTYSLYGKVVEGQKLGRTLGFPTANLSTSDECLPPTGVYKGSVLLPDGNTTHTAVINLGKRPTVAQEASPISIEAHLLDYNGDLYGKVIEVSLLNFIRSERKFPSLEALKEAISQDVAATRS